MTSVAIRPEVINEFMPLIRNTDFGKSSEEKFRITLSIGLFAEGSISLEKASEMSGKSLNQFIDILISKNIPWNEYTREHLAQDDLAVKKYLQDKEDDD
jgi:predicted HTH domain antitoxin